jgi:heptose-I-phosphate ethanolaminephosphotransferase
MGKSAINGLFQIVRGGELTAGLLVNNGEVLLMAYLTATIVYLASHRWVKVTAYAVVFILFLFREFIRTVFIIDISPNVVALMLETDSGECTEFFHYYVCSAATLKPLMFTLLLALLAWGLERLTGKIVPLLKKVRRTLAVITALCLLWGLVSAVSYVRMLRCQDIDELSCWDYEEAFYADPITKLAGSFYGLHLASSDMEHFLRHTREVALRQKTECPDSLNMIVVIGESYIKSHSSLYGYGLKTCPWQEAARDSGNLTVFRHVRTSSNMTSVAMKNILSSNSSYKGEKWNEGVYFPSLLKQAGWKVFLWDNQRTQYTSMTLSFSLNAFMYNPTIRDLSYTMVNERSFDYDGELVQDFAKTVKKEGKCNLILFHLKGQHFDAVERFPHQQEFLKFTKDDVPNRHPWMTDAKRQEVADYDNATLYNDYVLSCIAALYQEQPTVMVYFPDHGEEIYDYRDSKGRAETDGDEMMRVKYDEYQYQIPFVVWCSDRFIQQHKQDYVALQQLANKPFHTDDVCRLVFRLCGLNEQ